jgi:hypothetical protein
MPTKKGLRLLHGKKQRFIVCPQGDMIEAAKMIKEHHPEFSKHCREGEKSSRHSRGSSRATKPHRRSVTKARRRRPKLKARLRSNCSGSKRLTKFYFARSTWNFLQLKLWICLSILWNVLITNDHPFFDCHTLED